MQVSHVFINKMANGEESAQKTGRSGALGLLLAAASLRSKPAVRCEPAGPCLRPCLGSAEPGALPACPSLSLRAPRLGPVRGGHVRTP